MRSPVPKKGKVRQVTQTIRQPVQTNDPELELALAVALKVKVLALVRAATHDATPPLQGKPKSRFMYWNPR
jgi:hypothetical protein